MLWYDMLRSGTDLQERDVHKLSCRPNRLWVNLLRVRVKLLKRPMRLPNRAAHVRDNLLSRGRDVSKRDLHRLSYRPNCMRVNLLCVKPDMLLPRK